MGNKKDKRARGKKKYKIELSGGSLFLGGLALFFVLAWIFVLGILVGRGLIPEKVKKLTRFKEQVLGIKKSAVKEGVEEEILNQKIKEPEFEFVKKLPQKKSPAVPDPVRVKGAGKAKAIKAGKGAFTVQLASFDDEGKAKTLVNTLIKKGCQAYSHKAVVAGKVYYRVRAGQFKSRQEAQKYKQTLQRLLGLNGFVCKAD